MVEVIYKNKDLKNYNDIKIKREEGERLFMKNEQKAKEQLFLKKNDINLKTHNIFIKRDEPEQSIKSHERCDTISTLNPTGVQHEKKEVIRSDEGTMYYINKDGSPCDDLLEKNIDAVPLEKEKEEIITDIMIWKQALYIMHVDQKNKNIEWSDRKFLEMIECLLKARDMIQLKKEEIPMFVESLKKEIKKADDRASDLPPPLISLKTKINDLPLSQRAKTLLKRHFNIISLEDLLQKNEIALRSIPYFGKGCLKEVKTVLNSMGLQLK